MGIWDIFIYSLREAIRARFYLGTLAFVGVTILGGAVIGGVPFGDVDQVIFSLGWGAVLILSLALAILYSAQVLHRDKDRRILYMLLARPVQRSSYLIGKYLAVSFLLMVSVTVMGLFLWACVAVYGNREHSIFEIVIPAMWISAKAISMVGFTIALSIHFGYLSSLFMSFSIYVSGSSLESALGFLRQKDTMGLKPILEVVKYIFPNFDLFDVVGRFLHEMAVPDTPTLILGCGYFIGYGLVALGISAYIFDKRDLS